ncbi:G5 domain-containing protein, partial [Macrococcus epidermidis]|uniref:G5 domain-containing protein n=3 Tax=Macrococcus TaxID=69965 RepID=UPI001EF37ABD
MKKLMAGALTLTVLMSGVQSVVQDDSVYAAKSKVTYKIVNKKTNLNYKTIEEKSDALNAGEKQVKVEGKKGYKIVVYKQTLSKGKVIKSTFVKIKKKVNPVNKVVLVGTKKASDNVATTPPTSTTPVEKNELLKVTEPLAFDTKSEQDPTLEKGKEVVVREGKEGVREKAYNQRIVDGKVVSTTPAYVRVITEPISKIIKVGTKPVEKTELLKVTEPLAFDTKSEQDPTLEKGKEVVVREGKNGVREKAYNQRIVDGKVVSTTPAYVRVITEPISKIV